MTGVPAYFIHPCNTAEALKDIIDGKIVSLLEYLYIWFGVVGSAVGLHLPKEVVVEYLGKG